MNYKFFNTIVSSITHSPTAWSSLGKRCLIPGSRVVLPLLATFPVDDTNDTATAATLTLTQQAIKGEPGREKLYNHFYIQPPLDKNVPARYTQWRNENMTTIEVKVGGTKEEIVAMLEDMVGDSQCDGSWAGEGQVA